MMTALAGTAEAVRSLRPSATICEINSVALRGFGSSTEAVVGLLSRQDHSAHHLRSEVVIDSPATSFRFDGQGNISFLRSGRPRQRTGRPRAPGRMILGGRRGRLLVRPGSRNPTPNPASPSWSRTTGLTYNRPSSPTGWPSWTASITSIGAMALSRKRPPGSPSRTPSQCASKASTRRHRPGSRSSGGLASPRPMMFPGRKSRLSGTWRGSPRRSPRSPESPHRQPASLLMTRSRSMHASRLKVPRTLLVASNRSALPPPQ